ncbi:MAG: chorismate-binding protein, partial [Phycisphaerales bacterium]
GSIFWAGADGAFDSSVLIRTAACVEADEGWRLEAGAGAGLVADSTPAAERLETEAKISALLRALADLSRAARSGEESSGAVCSTLAEGDPARALVPEFIAELHDIARHLASAMSAGDLPGVRADCARIKGASAPLGFGIIAEAAAQALTTLAANNSVAESAAAIRALLSACVRAKADAGRGPGK